METLKEKLIALWSYLVSKMESLSILHGILLFIVVMFALSLLGFLSDIIGPVVSILFIIFLVYKVYDKFK